LTSLRKRLPALCCACAATFGLCLIAVQPPLPLNARPVSSLSGLKVAGNRITDAAGAPLMLRGFNRSGTEYACIELGSPGNLGWGIFDGPSDLASVQAMRSWYANYVRVPLNEDCWLGINGVSPTYGGANYRAAITSFVNLLNSNSMYVELSLIWGAPGTTPATSQPAAPDQDHSPAFWTSVAMTFKTNPDVFFGVWGEPTVSWSCFLNGCSNETGYQTAGSEELVNTIRATGATQPISVPGINYANDLSQWLTYEPADPLHALVAEAHVYGNNSCGAQSAGACLTAEIAPVALQVPVIFGETGETYDDSECTSSNMQVILPWADAHNVGYAAWTWDTWGTCLSLISSYNGSPNTGTPAGAAYGKYIHDHLLAVAGGRLPVVQSGSRAPIARDAVNPTTTALQPAPRIAWLGAPHSGRTSGITSLAPSGRKP